MNADEYNAAELAAGRLTIGHLTESVRLAQKSLGLDADGKCGPATRGKLEALRTPIVATAQLPLPTPPADLTIENGWLRGDGVSAMPIHSSWFYQALRTEDGKPKAIVAHYTSTDPGTGVAMARHRLTPKTDADRAASWHVSIESDGSIIQMARFTAGCWHAGGPTAKPISGLGPANRVSVGIELVGQGAVFPEAQVRAACRVWRALVRSYGILRPVAMVGHSELDPGRKTDPGPVWTANHAQRVLDYAFAPV